MPRCLAVIAFLLSATALGAAEYPVAGVSPDRRPANAPRITSFDRPSGWERRFFAGVVDPRPESLSWSADQGGWYTPFDRPGMTGPYDIRNWRVSKGKQK